MKNYKTITINSCLSNIYFDVIAYQMEVENNKTLAVSQLFDELISEIKNKYQISDVVNIPKLKYSRDGYKSLGIDPSRYRLATESLIRRIVKGFDVYRINDLVDLGNILSVKTNRSVCVVDSDKLVGDIKITKGTKEDIYEGINRGIINITNMPVYCDDISFFGTPTSDTMRTAVSDETKNIIVMIICFDSSDKEQDENILIDLYKTYANAKEITKLNVLKMQDEV